MTLVLLTAANISLACILFAGVGAFLKNAWNKEPVIVTACGIGLLGQYALHHLGHTKTSVKCMTNALKFTEPLLFAGITLPLLSPFTKYTAMINEAVPFNYPGEHGH